MVKINFYRICGSIRLVIFICVSVFAEKSFTGRSSNVFGECLRTSKIFPNLQECFGLQAIHYLKEIQTLDNCTLAEDFTVQKSENLAATKGLDDILDVEDPINLYGIIESAGNILSRRTMRWNLNNVYPGLYLQIGPTSNTESIVEFLIDPMYQNNPKNFAQDENISTGRILTEKFILPLLLGFKFNLMTLVPLIFTGIILVFKKIIFLANIVTLLNNVFGTRSSTLFTPNKQSSGYLFPTQTGSPWINSHFNDGLQQQGNYYDSGGYQRNPKNVIFEPSEEYQTFRRVKFVSDSHDRNENVRDIRMNDDGIDLSNSSDEQKYTWKSL